MLCTDQWNPARKKSRKQEGKDRIPEDSPRERIPGGEEKESQVKKGYIRENRPRGN